MNENFREAAGPVAEPPSMATLTEETWAAAQRGCDECPACRRDAALDTKGAAPGRPLWPEHQGRLVLISEAPPLTGGFWRTGQYDDLREHVFCVLQGLGCQFPSDLHGESAIRTFMAHNLFLLQTVKWPFAKGSRKRRPSYNSFGPRAQDALIAHTTTTHLGRELALLAPGAVLAMGNAAWKACVKFTQGRTDLDGIRVSDARGQLYEMIVEGRAIPLGVTSLPVDQNMRRTVEATIIRENINDFFGSMALNFSRRAERVP
jgi:uracil-DNA glycosylase